MSSPTEVLPFNAQIGAEVRCGDLRTLDDATFKEVRHAFLDNLVLLIRGQSLTDDELVAFGRRFGELTAAAPVHVGQKARERPEIAIIRKHEDSGHHALYLGRRPYSYVNGLSLNESETLLDAVWAHATQPQFTWHHQWQLGDVLIWDNRCTMHRRDAFDPTAQRIMHRTQCKGLPIVGSTTEDLAHLKPHARAAG